MDLIELTKKLISIPSFVDDKANEKEIGNFIYSYLKAIPYLIIEKQEVENNRFNIIAKDNYPPKLLICCHMDTTEPKTGCKYNQFSGQIENNKLYGLGSYDMKAGIASVLNIIKELNKTKGLSLLFYCDEEYDFKGMKKFLEQYPVKPELAISPEPTNLEIINGCRGVIEIYFKIKGETGHAARPEQGNNAIDGITNILNNLKQEIKKYQNIELGEPTLNIAYIKGGLERENNALGDRGNNIPDTAEAVLDIRTTDKELNADRVIGFIKKEIENNSLKLEQIEIRSDFSPLFTPKEKIKSFERELEYAKYGDIKTQGYFDGEMISRKLNTPFICFGPKGGNAHGSNEWVDVKSLNETKRIYKNLIKKFCF